ncbi:c-type cytochrome [Sphingomonas sp. SAFR-052]|uniref:c-type cytochrome n=1 Tax=Sphingomonas sp. SAFR-052 TaxID=3436867 RepID=UPI003F8088C2
MSTDESTGMAKDRRRRLMCRRALLIAAALSGCSGEARTVAPTVPQTPPRSDGDARIGAYQGNAYQIAQGGRYFGWYGCSACHGEGIDPVRNLADGRWRHGAGFAAVYRAIAMGHGGRFGRTIPPEQLWQITAYIRDLPTHTPEKRRRSAADQSAEPQGAVWRGPL